MPRCPRKNPDLCRDESTPEKKEIWDEIDRAAARGLGEVEHRALLFQHHLATLVKAWKEVKSDLRSPGFFVISDKWLDWYDRDFAGAEKVLRKRGVILDDRTKA